MAMWHTPQVMGVKFDDVSMAFNAKNPIPLRYYPQNGGSWFFEISMAPEASAAMSFGRVVRSNPGFRSIKGHRPTNQVDVEFQGDTAAPSPSDIKSAAGGAALGMVAAGPFGALAGAALASNGGVGTPLKLKSKTDGNLRLLIMASANMISDLRANLALYIAKSDW